MKLHHSAIYVFYCETSDLEFKKNAVQRRATEDIRISGIVHYDGLTIETECLLMVFVGMVTVYATVTPAPAVVTAASGARLAARC